MNSQHLIDLQGIKKIFYTESMETTALDDIHLAIDEGEYVSISGPSGCGKSTLLSVMGLLNSSTEGKYFLSGSEVTGLSATEQARVRNREIGFIFQAFNLIGGMSAFENVELPLTFRNDLDRKERRELVRTAMERVNIPERQKHFPAQLSGGQHNGWRSPEPWSANPRFCSRTSRPGTWIPRTRSWSWTCSTSCTARAVPS